MIPEHCGLATGMWWVAELMWLGRLHQKSCRTVVTLFLEPLLVIQTHALECRRGGLSMFLVPSAVPSSASSNIQVNFLLYSMWSRLLVVTFHLVPAHFLVLYWELQSSVKETSHSAGYHTVQNGRKMAITGRRGLGNSATAAVLVCHLPPPYLI